MDDNSQVTMTAEDRDEFLGNGGTGVIALSTAEADAPHAIPVSYGYDPDESTFYFRLAVGKNRSKGDLDGRAATFVVHGQADDDGDWRSVVAKGTLTDIEREEIEMESLAALDRVEIPLVDVFGAPTSDVSFQFVRLVPDELTAREEHRTRT